MEHIVVLCEDDGDRMSRYIRMMLGETPAPSVALTVLRWPQAAVFPKPHQVIVIVESENRRGLAAIRQQGLRAVTCGLSGRDTLTLSSITSDRAVVCLQRQLETADGRTIEPMEFPMAICEGTPPYCLLAAAAVLLLCGCEKQLLSR